VAAPPRLLRRSGACPGQARAPGRRARHRGRRAEANAFCEPRDRGAASPRRASAASPGYGVYREFEGLHADRRLSDRRDFAAWNVAPVCGNVECMRPELLRRLEEVVWVDPDRLSGAPCFRGTRIPVQMLIDHLTAGFSLDEFLETVPSLERGQAQRFLELAGEQMNECASSLTSV